MALIQRAKCLARRKQGIIAVRAEPALFQRDHPRDERSTTEFGNSSEEALLVSSTMPWCWRS